MLVEFLKLTFVTVLATASRLWRWSITTSMWTLMYDGVAQRSFYEQAGVASALNVVGSRSGFSMGINPFTGSVVIFGGSAAGNIYLNDFWQWDPATGFWTWLRSSTSMAVRCCAASTMYHTGREMFLYAGAGSQGATIS